MNNNTTVSNQLPPIARRGSRAARNYRYRIKKAAKDALIANEFKSVAAELNLTTPANLTKLPRVSLKGTKRPVYNPPDHIMALMTSAELTEWRANERKKRKAMKQKANRAKKSAIMKNIKEQLPVLKQRAKEKKMMEGGTVSFDSTDVGCTKDPPKCAGAGVFEIFASTIGVDIQADIPSQQQQKQHPPKGQEQEAYKEDRDVKMKPEATQMDTVDIDLDSARMDPVEIDLDLFDKLAPATVDDMVPQETSGDINKIGVKALMSDPIIEFDTESWAEDDADDEEEHVHGVPPINFLGCQEQEMYSENVGAKMKPDATQMDTVEADLDLNSAQMDPVEIDLDLFDKLAPATVDDMVPQETSGSGDINKIGVKALMSYPSIEFDTESWAEDDADDEEEHVHVVPPSNFFGDVINDPITSDHHVDDAPNEVVDNILIH